MCDESVWWHQQQHLSRWAEIVIPDFRGFDSLLSMAEAVLDRAPAEFALAGHSMGGRVALEVVNLAPEKVQRLALVQSGAYPLLPGEKQARQSFIELADAGGIEAVADTWISAMVHPDRKADRDLYTSIRNMVHRTSVEDFKNQVHALLMRADAMAYLDKINCRTLLIAGLYDTLYTVQQNEDLLKLLPNAYLVTLNAGHMAPMEVPEKVTKCLSDWLHEPA